MEMIALGHAIARTGHLGDVVSIEKDYFIEEFRGQSRSHQTRDTTAANNATPRNSSH